MQTSGINIDPAKRSGQPCIRDTRLTVKDVMEYLAGGMSEAEILAEFPYLTREDFLAVYGYAVSLMPGMEIGAARSLKRR